MRISEFLEKLQEIQQEFGDLNMDTAYTDASGERIPVYPYPIVEPDGNCKNFNRCRIEYITCLEELL